MKKLVGRLFAIALVAVMSTGCVGTFETPIRGSMEGTSPRMVYSTDDMYRDSDARGDIATWGVRYSNNVLELYLKTFQPTSIFTDPNWRWAGPGAYPVSTIGWEIDTNNDGYSDFDVDAQVNADGIGVVSVGRYEEVCRGLLGFNSAQEISVYLDPIACFGGTPPVSVRAHTDYWDLEAAAIPGLHTWDVAPETPEFSAWIAPGSAE